MSASIKVNRHLQVEVNGEDLRGNKAWVSVELSRINAQRIAHALLQYAGVETKSADLDPAQTFAQGAQVKIFGKPAATWIDKPAGANPLPVVYAKKR